MVERRFFTIFGKRVRAGIWQENQATVNDFRDNARCNAAATRGILPVKEVIRGGLKRSGRFRRTEYGIGRVRMKYLTEHT